MKISSDSVFNGKFTTYFIRVGQREVDWMVPILPSTSVLLGGYVCGEIAGTNFLVRRGIRIFPKNLPMRQDLHFLQLASSFIGYTRTEYEVFP